ncbi:hypothetical protein [Microbacterium kyungheense]|nr:hypothetical protein [Microbacterium kyungheense]
MLRALELGATSASAIRSVRARADAIGADYGHFTRGRRLTDDRVRAAVATSTSWAGVVADLGLEGRSATALAKGHSIRLGLEVSHLSSSIPPPTVTRPIPEPVNLARAGAMLAAGWFMLSGQDVSWPLEPCRYDLIVVDSTHAHRRVQVKTTTVQVGGTWKVYLSNSGRGRRTYDADEIDDFFVIDGLLRYYLIPIEAVGGLQAIHLASYDQYRLAPLPNACALHESDSDFTAAGCDTDV